MNSSEIRRILKIINTTSIPSEVYASDQLKYIKSRKFAIVVNTDDSSKAGQHWCAMFKDHDGDAVEFFDSFGLPLKYYGSNFSSFLKKKGKHVLCNNVQLQSTLSTCCGQFCIYFLHRRLRGDSFPFILHRFSCKKLDKNDDLVINFVRHNFSRTVCASHPSEKEVIKLIKFIALLQYSKSLSNLFNKQKFRNGK